MKLIKLFDEWIATTITVCWESNHVITSTVNYDTFVGIFDYYNAVVY